MSIGDIGGIAGGAGQFLGGLAALRNSGPSDWAREFLSDQQINSMWNYASVMEPWWQMYGGAVQGPSGGYNWADRANEMREWATSQQQDFGGLNPAAITQLYKDLGMNTTPQMEGAQQGIGDTAASLTGSRDMAGQGFQGGGWTPMYQQLFDRGSDMLTGQGAQNAVPANVGMDMLQQRGQDPYTRMLQEAMGAGINTGGMNPYLQAGQDIALGDLAMGGMTPGMAGMQQQAAGIINQGGQTPGSQAMAGVGLEGMLRGGGTATTDLLQGVGGNLFAQDALLGMDQAIGAAGDMASNAAAGQFEGAQRRALARGGGPGPVRGGIQNQGQAEYADQASRLISDAQNKAMMDQQGLQLQQRQMGGQIAGQAGQLEAGRLGQFSDTTGQALGLNQNMLGLGTNMMMSPEQIAAARMGQSYGAIPGMQGAGTDVMQSLMGGGVAGMNQELARMGLGGDLLQNYNQNRLQAMGSLGNIQANQNNYALGLGGLQNTFANSQMGGLDQMFNNWMSGANSGIDRAQGIQSGWLGTQQGSQAWNSLANNMWSTGMGMPMNAMSQLTDIAKGWTSGATNSNLNAQATT